MTEAVRAAQDRIIAAMSPEQKVLASERLRQAAWVLKAAWIRDRYPDLTESEVQEQVRRIFLDAGV